MYVFEGPVYLENKEREVIYQGSHGLVWQKGVLTQKEHFVKVNIGNVTVYLSSCLNLSLYIYIQLHLYHSISISIFTSLSIYLFGNVTFYLAYSLNISLFLSLCLSLSLSLDPLSFYTYT